MSSFEAHAALRAQLTTTGKKGQLYEGYDISPVPGPLDTDQWSQVKALLTRVETALAAAEHRAEKAEKRIETLEEFIRNELFSRINTSPPTGHLPPPSPPSSLPPSIALGQIPGIGLDLSRVTIPEIGGKRGLRYADA